jgi:outer membrane protein TolC
VRRATAVAAVLALSALAPAVTRADTAAPAPRQLTMDEALAMARRANKNLVVERARLAQAHTNIEQAWSVLFPVVTAQGKYTRNYKNATLDFGALLMGLGFTPMPGASNGSYNVTILKENQLDANVGATMPLIAPAAYPALDAVKKGYGSSEANYEASENTVLYSVAQAFYAAAVSDEVLLVRDSAINVAQATLDNSQSRFSAGTVTKVDVDRAELALVRARQGELDARYAREQSYRALSTLIQAEGPLKVVPAETLPPPGETDLDMALHLRPEFRGLILSEESSDAQRRAYAWQWAPTLSAFAKANIGNYIGFTGDKYAWSVGAQLDWTLFDGGKRDAQRHLAAAQAAQAAAQAAVLTDSIRDDLANNRSLLDTRREGVKAAQRGAELAEETLDLVRSQYEAGTVAQIDLLNAQDNVVIAQESLASARFDAAIADLALRFSAGTFPPR